jgi:hypothetical protein
MFSLYLASQMKERWMELKMTIEEINIVIEKGKRAIKRVN